ncbi:MAG: sugar ABC transporter permease [Anaerolineales bacterium]|nr:sugar ABC transporter permease [Anaerolineales bacterium]
MATNALARLPDRPAPIPLWKRIARHGWGYIFVSPWVLLYLVFGIYPLVLSFFLTFFNYSFVTPDERTFVGIGNWIRGLEDPLYWKAIYNIAINQSVFIILKNGLGLLIAALLFRIKYGGRIFRTIYFLPVITSTVVLMTIGDNLASPGGPIQKVLIDAHLLDGPLFWKADQTLPMIIIALINTWKWFGISMIILLAGMYSIDKRLYEVAAVDGANEWQMFWKITLPLLRPQLFFLLVVDIINGLQMFGEVFTIGFSVYGGVNNQALTPVLYLYAQAFDRSNVGYASTLGLMLAFLIAALTVFQFKFFPAEDE